MFHCSNAPADLYLPLCSHAIRSSNQCTWCIVPWIRSTSLAPLDVYCSQSYQRFQIIHINPSEVSLFRRTGRPLATRTTRFLLTCRETSNNFHHVHSFLAFCFDRLVAISSIVNTFSCVNMGQCKMESMRRSSGIAFALTSDELNRVSLMSILACCTNIDLSDAITNFIGKNITPVAFKLESVASLRLYFWIQSDNYWPVIMPDPIFSLDSGKPTRPTTNTPFYDLRW